MGGLTSACSCSCCISAVKKQRQVRPSEDHMDSPVDQIIKESAIGDGNAPVFDQKNGGNPFGPAVDPGDAQSKVHPEEQPKTDSTLDLRKQKDDPGQNKQIEEAK